MIPNEILKYSVNPLSENEINQLFLKLHYTIPNELLNFYRNSNGIEAQKGINILGLEKTIEYTFTMDFHPLASYFNLIFFEDANNSNPFCIISNGPLTGYILHLFHDDEPRIVFRSLSDFINEIKRIIITKSHIDDINYQINDDNSNLNKIDVNKSTTLLNSAQNISDEELKDLIITIGIQLVDSKNEDVVINIANIENNFFLNESIANVLGNIGTERSLQILQDIKKTHPQVETTVKIAIDKIKKRIKKK